MKRSLLLAACCIPLVSPGAEIRFSGYLAQSNPAKPLDFIGVSGLVDACGKFYFCHASRLWSFETFRNILPAIPFQGHCRQLAGDGKCVWLKDERGMIRKWNPAMPKKGFLPVLQLKHPGEPVAIVPRQWEHRGWGKRLKIAVLRGNAIWGFDADGHPTGKVVTLPEGKTYHALSFFPESGDLLVAIAYPENRILRYSPDGTQFPRDYRCSLHGMFSAGKTLFGAASALIRIPENFDEKSIRPRTNGNDMIISGAVQTSDGGYTLGTTQGLIHYPANRLADPVRAGGFPECSSLAVNDDGLILALSNANRNLVYALNMDDAPDSPLASCNDWISTGLWNSPRFRKGTALSVSASGDGFYVLNRNGDRNELWHFTPNVATGNAWKKMDVEVTENARIASSPEAVFLLSNGRVEEIRDGKRETLFTENTAKLIAADEAGIAVCGDSKLSFYHLKADGTFNKAWSRKCPSSLALAVGDTGILVASQTRLQLYSMEDGQTLATWDMHGNSTAAIAVRGNWIFVADSAKKAIARYKRED